MEDQKPLDGEMTPQVKRHGFITFWLWLMIIANGVLGVLALIGLLSGGADGAELVTGCVSAVLLLANMFAAIQLLRCKRIGFWIFVAVAAINVVMAIIGGAESGAWPDAIRTMAGSILGPVILYAILGIKKEDVPYWTQLQ